MMTFDSLITEAFEQAGIDAATLTHRHLNAARRSLDLLHSEIETDGARPEFRVQQQTISLQKGQTAIIMPENVIDVLDVYISSPPTSATTTYDPLLNRDLPLGRMTREDWMRQPNKVVPGLPQDYWLSKSVPAEVSFITPIAGGWGIGNWSNNGVGGVVPATGTTGYNVNQSVMVLWPALGFDNCKVVFSYLRTFAMPDGIGGAIDGRRNWVPTICKGLARDMALKFNVERHAMLEGQFAMMIGKRMQSEDRGAVVTGFRAHGFSRRRRH